MTALQKFADVLMLLPGWVIVPVVALNTLQREEDASAPYVISEGKPEDHGGVEVFELIASLHSTPVRRFDFRDAKVSLCGNKVLHILVYAEKDFPLSGTVVFDVDRLGLGPRGSGKCRCGEDGKPEHYFFFPSRPRSRCGAMVTG
jgi:hypothetical protein